MKLLLDTCALIALSDGSLPAAAADLPLIHRDPFDRVLIATALRDGLTILTSDRSIPAYPGIETHW